ncbi:MAG: hypothetical protein E4G89_04390 [Methanothrix sp.]|nr:MAG: hypothetical protein E4G89_04390 [Methanothrix sp.]
MDAFNEYSNEYEFTAEGVFRRIKSPACLYRGKQISHNGYNRYSILYLANIKLGKYLCKKCNMSLQEENTFWEKTKFEFSQSGAGFGKDMICGYYWPIILI